MVRNVLQVREEDVVRTCQYVCTHMCGSALNCGCMVNSSGVMAASLNVGWRGPLHTHIYMYILLTSAHSSTEQDLSTQLPSSGQKGQG